MRRRSLARPLLQAATALAAAAALALWFGRRFVRYEVSGESMSPAFRPGDWLVARRHRYRQRLPRRGDAVLLRDPEEPSRILLKRVVRTDLHGLAWVEGDNAGHSRDSRQFGPVPASALAGRVSFRYWPLFR